jgi:hypothetical protein
VHPAGPAASAGTIGLCLRNFPKFKGGNQEVLGPEIAWGTFEGEGVTIMGLVEFDFGRALNAEQTLLFFNHASPHHQGEKANGS